MDTSSLVPFTLRRDLQQAAQLGAFTALWSPWIVAELNRVLVWRWIERHGGDRSRASERRCGQAARAMMVLLLGTFELVDPTPPYPAAWEALSDEGDHPIWAAAVAGAARYVISENTRDYPPAQSDGRHIHAGIEYLGARAFLQLLAEAPGEVAQDGTNPMR